MTEDDDIVRHEEPEMVPAASEPVEVRTQYAANLSRAQEPAPENIDIPAFLRRGGL
jgi:hypothetical protein